MFEVVVGGSLILITIAVWLIAAHQKENAEIGGKVYRLMLADRGKRERKVKQGE